MFRPNIHCLISRLTGDYDIHGQPAHEPAKSAWCAVVRLSTGRKKTSVRADSSASRGNAIEEVSDAKILFMPFEPVGDGDKIEVSGVTLRVIRVEQRFSVTGLLDHYEVDCEVWA